MFRIFGFLVVVAALIGGSVWMADHPGMVTVRWLAWRIDTSVPVLALALLIAAVALVFVLRFLSGFLGLPGRFARRARERRQAKGTAALAGAVTALAAGEAAKAKRCLKDADKALQNPQLTHLLAAQIAAAEGDAKAAQDHYEALLDTPETELVGLRGLIAAPETDAARALSLAERAFSLAPEVGWTSRAAFAAQVKAGRLEAAQDALAAAQKKGGMDAAQAKAEKARLLAARAEAARSEGKLSDAAKFARDALDLDPAAVAAGVALAQIHAAEDRPKKAAEVLRKLWKDRPDPRVLAACLDLWREEDAAQQMTRVRDLVADAAELPESRLAVAEAALRAQAFGAAREAVQPLLGPDATAANAGRAALVMARVLAAEGADATAQREWIERAAAGLAA